MKNEYFQHWLSQTKKLTNHQKQQVFAKLSDEAHH